VGEQTSTANTSKPGFLNFTVDHMTMIMQPEMYNVTYVLFRVIFGVPLEDVVYEKRKEWKPGEGEKSMTYAVSVGKQDHDAMAAKASGGTVIALVQPTEPKSQSSHVRTMLQNHSAAAHWQHIALRTPDLLSFHEHAIARGVNFITPILRDDGEDLIQVFSGEWYHPGSNSSAMFFEFVQRDPTDSLLKMLEERNRESWFRDKTFLGLYGEKEAEYKRESVTPFIDFELFNKLQELVGKKNHWEISEDDIASAEKTMMEYAQAKKG
jgi:hypothetical protein